MKSQTKHITSIVLLVSMIVMSVAPLAAYGFDFDSTQSSWAKAEIKQAFDLELTYSGVMSNFKNNITREEFCTLDVKLYERLSGKPALKGTDPFQDTDNEEILKAYELGIVKGTSPDTFSPKSNITRQEICAMIFRTLGVSVTNINEDTSGDFPFKDAAKISTWAVDSMKFAYKNEIMKGLSVDTIDPLSNTTREQAILLLLRTFKKYTTEELPAIIPEAEVILPGENTAMISIETGPVPSVIQKSKFEFMVNTNNIFFPKFDKKVELFVSTKPGKPTSLPVFSFQDNTENLYGWVITKPIITLPPIIPPIINPPIIINPNLPELPDVLLYPPVKERPSGPIYAKSDFSSFIDKNGDKVRWFAFKLMNSLNAKKVIYQVASSQFSGYKEGWNTQSTIVYTGEVATSAKEFSIDFSKVVAQDLSRNSLSGRSIPPKQKTYYVRAVLVDSWGNPIGDPAKGVAILYGEPQIAAAGNTVTSFELWTPSNTYKGIYTAEFKDLPAHPVNGETFYSPQSKETRLFYFHGIDIETKKITIQVSNEKFEKSNSSNIVYEKEYTLPVSTNNLPSSAPLPSVLVAFSDFGKKASEMAENQFIYYYIRGITFKDSDEAGKLEPSYSDVIKVKYGFGPTLKLQIPQPPVLRELVKINVGFPTITIKEYKEVQWPDPDYMQHYYVADTPKPTDITCSWKNTTSGEVLPPFYSPTAKFSAANYLAAINRVLPVNAKVYIPDPSKVDKPWYKELLDGVIGFFSDLIFYMNKIYNTVKATYDNLKNQLVSFVANLCPIPSLRGYFETALAGLMNYGLMCIGIPPELPDFAKLVSGNMDYFVDVALTEAGIPQGAVTDAVRQEMEKQVVNQFEQAGKVKDENPLNAAFLKLDPDYLYRPAYVDIEIKNDTNFPTVAGTVDLDVDFRFKGKDMYSNQYTVGLNLVVDTNQYGYTQTGAVVAASDYSNHFFYGLNGYTVDYLHADEPAIYDVFVPMRQLVVPSIRPHTAQMMRIYLEPSYAACSSRYPNAEKSMAQDFYNMYFTHGDEKYTYFTLTGYFPTAEEYLLQDAANKKLIFSLDPTKNYEYSNGGENSYYWDPGQYKYIILEPSSSKITQELQRKVKYGWIN